MADPKTGKFRRMISLVGPAATPAFAAGNAGAIFQPYPADPASAALTGVEMRP
jgi:hypothetical protein